MKRFLFLMLALNTVALPTASAAVSDADIAQLREQLVAMSQRLEELAAENAELRNAQDRAATAIADVIDDEELHPERGIGCLGERLLECFEPYRVTVQVTRIQGFSVRRST